MSLAGLHELLVFSVYPTLRIADKIPAFNTILTLSGYYIMSYTYVNPDVSLIFILRRDWSAAPLLPKLIVPFSFLYFCFYFIKCSICFIDHNTWFLFFSFILYYIILYWFEFY